MNEEEFLNQYMSDSGIFEQSRAFGRRKEKKTLLRIILNILVLMNHITTFFEKKTKNINK